MTEDVSFQKGLMLIGKPRSGKGTTLRISEWLGGTRAFISLDLDKWLQGEFSGEAMIGKKVLAFPDVRLKEGKWYGQNFDPGGVDYKSVQRLLKTNRRHDNPWAQIHRPLGRRVVRQTPHGSHPPAQVQRKHRRGRLKPGVDGRGVARPEPHEPHRTA